MPVRDTVVLILVVASLPVCFLRPFYGVLVWTILAIVNPQQLSWGVAQSIPLAQLVAVATILGALFFGNIWSSLQRREVALIGVLWIWFTITSVHASNTPALVHYQADTWYRWTFVSKVLLMTVVSVGLVNTWPRLRIFLLTIAGCFGFFLLKAIPWMVLTGGVYRFYGPPGTMLGDNNDFGLALNMTLPIFFFLAKTESASRLRWLMWLLFAVTIPGVFFTYSRGALVGLMVVLFFMIMLSSRRIPLLLVLLVMASFALLFTPEHWQKRMDFRKEGSLMDASGRSRINSWTYSWRLAMDYPLTGGGFEAFTQPLFYRYAPNPLDVHGPHSIYFGVLAEQGFVGLFLYLTLIASCYQRLRRVQRYAREFGDLQANNYSLMIQLSMIGFLTSGAFLGRAYFDYYFTLVACVAILAGLSMREAAGMLPSYSDSADAEAEAMA